MSDQTATAQAALRTTPLNQLHRALGARMVPFAGYDMPVQYPAGVMAEHRHTRSAAGLFDVSHMGQIRLDGPQAAAALESLVPVDVMGLQPGQQRYAVFTNEMGGILDDLMIVRPAPHEGYGDLLLVVNAACKDADLAHLRDRIGSRCQVNPLPDQALLALQGPQAVDALAALNPAVSALRFMQGRALSLAGAACFVTRSGYTGEDGFEISVPAAAAEHLARVLLADPRVQPIGLGARDTLRLEAGLCLYGHDIDVHTSPIEAGLQWAIQKVRRPGGERAGGYPGADRIGREFSDGVSRKRVGLLGQERVPVREGAALHDTQGSLVGRVTSGTLGPTVNQPVHVAPGTVVFADVRGKRLPMTVSAMPFTPHRYRR
ncbi:MAG: glycine cleavage system aminomethyltransferase GcvT [Burkholderiaceae bacterium]